MYCRSVAKMWLNLKVCVEMLIAFLEVFINLTSAENNRVSMPEFLCCVEIPYLI
jgi:hypothetical protein